MKQTTKPKAKRGFAAMTPEMQRALSRKGGRKVSRKKAHMASIGAKGGLATQAKYKLVRRK